VEEGTGSTTSGWSPWTASTSGTCAAHADHFIRTLPDGYATVLNEEASNISQGQRQLLTIARAILIDPAILILVMNHGKIIETGTHKRLLVKNGFSAELYNSQFTCARGITHFTRQPSRVRV
jgi:ATP-binding cassette subfamily B multidrug efflux pump